MEESLSQARDAAIKKFYHQLDQQQLDQENLEIAAKLALYYAHGATEKASSQLKANQAAATANQQQLKMAMDSLGLSTSLVKSAKMAVKDADNTRTLASAVAEDVENSTQNLSQLAADIAAAYAIATSSDMGTEIHMLLRLCLDLTKKAAAEAETASLRSMDTTIRAAQSKATLVSKQADIVREDIDRLAQRLSLDHNELQKTIEQGSEAVSAALLQENKEDGRFQLARQEDKALNYTHGFVNQHLNHNLHFQQADGSGERFSLSFGAFAETATSLASPIKIAKEYRILIVAEEDAPGFNFHDAKHSKHFFSIEPKLKQQYQQEFILADSIAKGSRAVQEEKDSDTKDAHPAIATDFKGIAIERGKSYVFFVFLEYISDHQHIPEDLEGKLSLASPPFKLLTDLPVAHNIKLQFYPHQSDKLRQCSSKPAVRVSFTLPKAALHLGKEDLAQMIDFRVLLFKKNDELAFKLNHLTENQLAQLVLLEEKDRQARRAYLQAKQKYDNAIANDSPGRDRDRYKQELELASMKYQILQQETEVEEEILELLNESKLSNFYLDANILLQIPQAYSLKAKVNNQLLFELRDEMEGYKIYQEALGHREEEIAKELEKLKTEAKQEGDSLQIVESTLNSLEAEYQKIEAKQTVAIEQMPEKIKDIHADLYQLISILHQKGKQHEVIKLLEEIEADEAFLAEIKERATTLHQLQKEIAILKKERLQLKQSLQSIKEKEQYEIKQQIEVHKKLEETHIQIQLLQEEIHAFEEKDQDVENQDEVRYVAVNENGDFTNNYGEPLQMGEAYVALVLSVIKDDQLDRQAQFKTSFSPFSGPQIYHLK